MKRLFGSTLIIASATFLVTCNTAEQKKGTDEQGDILPSDIVSKAIFDGNRETSISDTSFTIFNDKNYLASFKVFKPTNSYEEAHLGILSLIYRHKNQNTILLHDSLEFFQPLLQLRDFNGDSVKDLLILCSSSARSNWTHYLYLMDTANHRLKRVKGFEEVRNPEIDSTNNIITSIAHAGKDYYSFYQIAPNGELLDLGNSFEDDGAAENEKYEVAIRNILKKRK